MLDELTYLAAALADQAHHHHIGFGLTRDHAQQHALADAAACEQPYALAATERKHAVDRPHADVEHTRNGLLFHRVDPRRMQVEGILAEQRAKPIERRT
nr:hypothetical protein [Dyella acidiphila]